MFRRVVYWLTVIVLGPLLDQLYSVVALPNAMQLGNLSTVTKGSDFGKKF